MARPGGGPVGDADGLVPAAFVFKQADGGPRVGGSAGSGVGGGLYLSAGGVDSADRPHVHFWQRCVHERRRRGRSPRSGFKTLTS